MIAWVGGELLVSWKAWATLPSFDSWGCLVDSDVHSRNSRMSRAVCMGLHGYTAYIHCQNKAHRPITAHACDYVGREERILILGALRQASRD